MVFGNSCFRFSIVRFDIEKDFESGDNPRDAIFENKWDRHTAKKTWLNYINNV